MSCRPSNKLSSTSLMSLRRGRCIKERWRKLRPQWCLISLRTAPSPHHHQDPNDLPTVLPSLPTTVSTWRSRCSAPTTPYSPAQCTFSHRGSVLFGVCCESIPWQMTYLIDESVDMGKGSNAIVSMLHHFFENHGLGEERVHLHADNCGGQNKNAIMVQYLLWRVMTGQHKEITLSFMIPGHTKFSPDWCFGLLKIKYRRTEVGGLADLFGVVNEPLLSHNSA